MTTLEERVAAQESRGDQLDNRLGELREDVRAGFARIDRGMESGFARTDKAIDELRKLLISLLIAMITGAVTVVILLAIAVINLLAT